ncbi:MAG: PD-(D/E)XK nuclease family transposase [Ruminococcus sp.]|nr:PD-(D/E)XK nuclease family transposase [Ruminococcus sp.]
MAIKDSERRKAEMMAKIPEFTLMDDLYMNAFFNGQPELAQFVLRIILDNSSLIVKRSVTQKALKNIRGRSVTLDVYAVDGDGREINIEVQGESRGAEPKRARFHSSMLDSNAPVRGEDFSGLPETYVIFITSKDYFKKGLPVYTINRRIDELGMELFGDGEHIIYVNGEYINDTPVGRLMHDFKCKKPGEMFYEPLAERSHILKETEKGRGGMYSITEEIRREGAREEKILSALSMLEIGKLTYEEISKCSRLTVEEVEELARQETVRV